MFKVEHDNRGFKISIGDGRPAFARDLAAISLALAHYFSVAHGQVMDSDCPFCHQMIVAAERPVIKYQDCGCRIRAKVHTCGLVREEATP